MAEMPQIYRPIPRRTFDLAPVSNESSIPPSPSPEYSTSDLLTDRRHDIPSTPGRTRSILNLTSSTLLGIYSPTSYHDGSREEMNTPWGTGAQTPSYRRSTDESRPNVTGLSWMTQRTRAPAPQSPRRNGFRAYYLPLFLRSILLSAFGIAYGTVITQLHDKQQIAPVPVSLNRQSWTYQAFWGICGVLVGNLLPWIDGKWQRSAEEIVEQEAMKKRRPTTPTDDDPNWPSDERDDLGAHWYSAVRSIGAFVGIAFAIRKLPWESTLQASLTLALANPVLWYLIDRSKPGFALSTAVGIAGTIVLLGINPDLVPAPTMSSPDVSLSNERIGVVTWIASVLFCSCVCFGNIGRRLALPK